MTIPLLSIKVSGEQDLVGSRQRTRQLAALLGFDSQDQTRLATAVSEICRNAYRYAGGGRIEFSVEGSAPTQLLSIRVVDTGPGIPDVAAILQGRYKSSTGMGLGIQGTRRLVDHFRIDTNPGQGTAVTMLKAFPKRAPALDARTIGKLTHELATVPAGTAFEEFQAQNQELLRALEELRMRQLELRRLNQELEDTNRGVVALYAELDENAERLKQANQLKSTFLSHMSHEFRTPLNSIMALAGILLQRLDGPLTAEQEKQVKFMHRAAQELTDMVNDLLDLAKVEAGKIELHPAELRVSTLFGTLRGMLRPLLFQQPVQLSFEYSQDFSLYTDEAKLSQILRNFISNAIKFTDKGDIRVSADSDETGAAVRFSVADTGIGIAPEDQERIFQQFAQVDNTRQRNVKGTGLGLPLSKKLAELLGGHIELVSTPGAGSTFSVFVPVRLGEQTVRDSPADTARRHTESHKIVIFVGDEERSERYRSVLDEVGLRAAVCVTEREAKLLIEGATPDVGVVHVSNTGEAGWRVLRLLREQRVPTVAIGGSGDEQNITAAGAEFEPEPLNMKSVIARLQGTLDVHARPAVLVIDDDDMARYLIRKHLSDMPVHVIDTHDAMEGLERARHERPQVIILDLMMPEVSGFETLDELKADTRTRDIPIVIHTSMSLPQRDRDLLSEKAAAVLDKNSIESGKLRAVIAQLVQTVTK
jgi:signal transduction histidine kinase/CheY-like chemotaxis protein